MSIEEELDRPAGAGAAIERTWETLRPDEPSEDEDDLEEIEDDLDDEEARDGEVMDDPVDRIGSASIYPFQRDIPEEDDPDSDDVAPSRIPAGTESL